MGILYCVICQFLLNYTRNKNTVQNNTIQNNIMQHTTPNNYYLAIIDRTSLELCCKN